MILILMYFTRTSSPVFLCEIFIYFILQMQLYKIEIYCTTNVYMFFYKLIINSFVFATEETTYSAILYRNVRA